MTTVFVLLIVIILIIALIILGLTSMLKAIFNGLVALIKAFRRPV